MSAPASSRPRARSAWADARLILGLVLIAASVAGVWLVVSAARQTAPAYAAAATIVPGQPITAGDLREVEVGLGQIGDAYLTDAALGEGLVATRTIGAGELIPLGAVADAGSSRTTTIVLRSQVEVPASVDTGTVVEVWVAPLVERGVYDVPRILIPDATVVSVDRDDAVIGGASAAVELVIPRADVAATLEAIAGGAALSVVPVAGASR